MYASRRTDNNSNNNNNYDVSINIPEANLQPGKDPYNELTTSKESVVVEPRMAKVSMCQDLTSKKSKRTDERAKHSEEEEEERENNEGTDDEDKASVDESDGPKRKLCFVQLEDQESNNGEIEIDETESKKIHSYAAKKTVAQGMMDIALITANANQLRYIIEFNRSSSTFYVIVSLIVFSLILQVAVGMALIFKGRLDIKGKSKDPDAKRINNYVVVAIFLVTIVNVFIASFTITGNSAKTH